jgi:hypothetical protein
MYKASFGFIFCCVILSLAYMVQDNPHGDNFNLDCELCHNPDNWQVVFSRISFDHSRTDFPLMGAHRLVKCRSCHVSLVFDSAGQKCIDCHKDIHQGEFGISCEECHSSQSWENRQALFARHSQTRFPLLGVHAMLDCETCHPKFLRPQFTLTAVECQGCHAQTYLQTTNPEHARAGFSLACENCHSAASWSWQNALYEHSPLFPLTGGHSGPGCNDCHQSQFSGTSPLCYTCHQANYNAALDPDHVQYNFDHDCTVCHNTIAWDPATFDHNLSNFPLTGAHAALICTQCHTTGYTNTPSDCYSCHQADYAGAADPAHTANNFSHDCSTCHTSAVWQPAYFNHANTNFPLSGAHVALTCAQCHSSGYNNTPADCFACHATDFNGAGNPDHISNNFDHNCTLCHNTAGWQPSIFNHNQTAFPLTGAHLALSCIQCHAGGYVSTPQTCFACHESDFNGVSDPNHVSNNFNHDCSQCHTTATWQPASFDHASTGFALSGAHAGLTCAQCHSAGYSNTSAECVSCHQQNYNQTSNPNHSAAHFPVQCTTCHNTTAWQPANWNHDGQYFPIYSGTHQGQWSNCTNCHTNPNDYAIFSCITCHEHNQTEMNAKHSEVQNYAYDSNLCYTCHPTGRGGD